MKQMKFGTSNVPLILDGSKTATWRMKDDKNLTAGDEVIFVDASSGEDFALASLTNIHITTITNMTVEDAVGNVGFTSKEELLEYMRQTYGEDVTVYTPLKIVRFHVTKKTK